MSRGRATATEEGASRWRAAAGAPSFVLLMPDDFPRNFLGAAHGLTPTLDRLRATGVNFARAYATAPLCSAPLCPSTLRYGEGDENGGRRRPANDGG